jgi:hypothetical protein
MRVLPVVLWVGLGCTAHRAPESDAASLDAGLALRVDVPKPPIVAPADVLDVGSVGEWISFRPERVTGVIAPCGRGEPVSYFTPGSIYMAHTQPGTLLFSVVGRIMRADLQQRTSHVLTPPLLNFSSYTSQGDDGSLALYWRHDSNSESVPKSLAIIRMNDELSGGRIIWQRNFTSDFPNVFAGGLRALVATDRFVAFVMATSTQIQRLYVGGPNAEDMQPAPEGLLPTHARGEGDRMVFDDGNDIWLYTHSTRRFENLTRDRPVQYQPWISGDHVVWVDLRHGGGSALNASNPEIYHMDLRDRVPHRVTHDPVERPAIQGFPMIDGEWIVWADKRHDAQPNSVVQTTRSALYGWHLGTAREVVIDDAADGLWLGLPFVHDGWVYYSCSIPSQRQRDSYYRQRLPTPRP